MFASRLDTTLKRCAVAALAGAMAWPVMAAERTIDPAQAERAVTVIDDPLELETVLSTENVAPSVRGLFRERRNDSHLRALVDKRTGQVAFEVRQTFNYDGLFRDYGRVNYETGRLPGVAQLQRLDANREHCEAFDAGTACFEEAAFAVPERELRAVLEGGGGAGDPSAWELKFKPVRGQDHFAKVPLAEVEGLLRAVDAYRTRSGLPAPTTAADAASTPSEPSA